MNEKVKHKKIMSIVIRSAVTALAWNFDTRGRQRHSNIGGRI